MTPDSSWFKTSSFGFKDGHQDGHSFPKPKKDEWWSSWWGWIVYEIGLNQREDSVIWCKLTNKSKHLHLWFWRVRTPSVSDESEALIFSTHDGCTGLVGWCWSSRKTSQTEGHTPGMGNFMGKLRINHISRWQLNIGLPPKILRF